MLAAHYRELIVSMQQIGTEAPTAEALYALTEPQTLRNHLPCQEVPRSWAYP